MKTRSISVSFICLLFSFAPAAWGEEEAAPASALKGPVKLRCEYLTDPIGVDVARPRLFWQDVSDCRGAMQTAWQIVVKRGDTVVWDSGKVASANCIQIEYAGPVLPPDTAFAWRVRAWDQEDRASAWSEAASFATGLPAPADWNAQWIARRPQEQWQERWDRLRAQDSREREHWLNCGDTLEWYRGHNPPYEPAPLFRKTFFIDRTVKSARVYVTGLGCYHLFLNGRQIDGAAIAPGITNYSKRILYDGYDVTAALRSGGNAIGLELGHGWYSQVGTEIWGFDHAPWISQPKALVHLTVELADGSRQTIVSDATWKSIDGPLVFDDTRRGEVYDATKEVPGWSEPASEEAKWEPVAVVAPPAGRLAAELAEPMRGTAAFATTRLMSLAPGGRGPWLFEFPQNVAGRATLRFDGSGMRGQVVKLSYYPYRNARGELGMNSWGQTQYYICKGEPAETVESRFAYFGGRYVLVEGLARSPEPGDVALEQVRSAVADAGAFATSDPLINRLQSNIRWTESSALHSYPQDCWTRERLGWTGDAHLTCEESIFNFGMAAFYTKYVRDHRDCQGADGGIPAFVPNFQSGNESVTWSGSCIVIPWQLYTYYGDRRILEEHFEMGERYLASAARGGKGNWTFIGGPGDWCPPWAKTPQQIPDNPELGVEVSTFPGAPEGNLAYGTAHYYRLARLMARIARILGKAGAAGKYDREADQVLIAFNTEFFDSAAGTYHGEAPADYRQAVNAHALWLGLVPPGKHEAVLQNLVGDILARQGGTLNTGVLGTQALFEGLPEAGRADVAFEMAAQQNYPGYLWPILRFGLTTLPEHWEGFGTHEHPMFGSVGAFFYKRLAGIQPDPAGPGFARFVLRPSIDNPLQQAGASYESIRGRIASSWRKEAGVLALDVEIPANTEASVFVPKYGYEHPVITESGQTVSDGKDAGDAIELVRGGGRYSFRVSSSEPLALGRNAGVRLTAADAVVTTDEPAQLRCQFDGKLTDAKLAASPVAGVRVDAIEPDGPHGFKINLSLAPDQAVWRAVDVPLRLSAVADGKSLAAQTTARLLVRPPVEMRYVASSVLAAPGYDAPIPLFTIRNTRPRAGRLTFDAGLPNGWGVELCHLDGGALAQPVELESGARLRLAARISPAANSVGGPRVPLEIAVLERGKRVGGVTIPVESAGSYQARFVDDFKTMSWTLDPDLKARIEADKLALSQPRGTRGMNSPPIVLDFSRPLDLSVNVPAADPETKWAVYISDEAGLYRAVIGDNSAIGATHRSLDDLGWSGLHRFRLRFWCIGGSVELSSLRIEPR